MCVCVCVCVCVCIYTLKEPSYSLSSKKMFRSPDMK